MASKFSLTKFSDAHFEDYLELVGNLEVMAMITERTIPREEARRDFEKILANNMLHTDFGHFRVTHEEDGDFLGLAKLELEHAAASRAELGYMLRPKYWGQGLGSEISSQLVARAKNHSFLVGLYAIIDPANSASKRILSKQGFVTTEMRDFDGLPGEILELVWKG